MVQFVFETELKCVDKLYKVNATTRGDYKIY